MNRVAHPRVAAAIDDDADDVSVGAVGAVANYTAVYELDLIRILSTTTLVPPFSGDVASCVSRCAETVSWR